MKPWKAAACALALLTVQGRTVGNLQAAPTSTQVYFEVGGQIEPANATFDVPYRAQRILFDISDLLDASPAHGSRVRYQLAGIDPDWRQKRDEMSFTTLFYDAAGDQVGQQVFLVNGKSAGWNGSAEQSTFTRWHETLVVPPGAEHLGVVISSAGPPTTVGIYVVDGVMAAKVRRKRSWTARLFCGAAADRRPRDGSGPGGTPRWPA